MRVLVLGPVGVLDAPVTVPSGQIAARVLAVLAAEANRPVLPARLADLVWPGGQRAGGNSLQAHISRWRKALGAHRITYSRAGYTLVVGPDELDALDFEELARRAAAARAAGDLTIGVDLCEEALALWRGSAFATLLDDDCVRERRVELEAAHAAVRLDRLEMLCESGAHEQLLPEAVAAAAVDPWSEPLHRLLARAHYGRGDQVAALEVLTQLERRLRQDLGLDLGPASQALRGQILRHEPALDLAGPQPTSPGSPETRLADRIDEMPPLTRRVLCAAALSTPEIDTALIGRVLTIDGPAFADAVAPALAAGIVVRGRDGVRFAAPAIQESVRALVTAGESLDLHRRLGQGLVARGGGDELDRRAADHLALAAATGTTVAREAVELDHRLARIAMARGRYADAARFLRRALSSTAHVTDGAGPDRAALWLLLGEAQRRAGELDAAMSSYRTAAQLAEVAADVLLDSALAYEECSLHARRHREGAHDPSIELLERAIRVVGPTHPRHLELLSALSQALWFSGLGERAARMADQAEAEARDAGDAEVLARTLLRRVSVHDPVRGAPQRRRLAQEAAALAQSADADELEIEALCASVPELMRAGRLTESEHVVTRIEHLVDIQGNVLHRCKVPMWRAAFALAAGRHAEAEILIEDFRQIGERDGYADTARIHGFQSILLALGRGTPEGAAAVLARFDHDQAFEPWRASRLAVAHARGDRAEARRLLEPWSARRFTLGRAFAGVEVFCACLVAAAVAEYGDVAARARLGAMIAPGVGQNQVLGAGAAMLGDAAQALALLAAPDGEHRSDEPSARAARDHHDGIPDARSHPDSSLTNSGGQTMDHG